MMPRPRVEVKCGQELSSSLNVAIASPSKSDSGLLLLWGKPGRGDPCFSRGVPSPSSACGMPQPPSQTGTNLLLVRQVVLPLVINSVLGELISGTLAISLLGIQAINIGAAPPGALQKGTA